MLVPLSEELELHKNSNIQPAFLIKEHVKTWAGRVFTQKQRSDHLEYMQQMRLERQQPLDRTIEFWRRSIYVYASYKICQLRAPFLHKDKQRKAWEDQHEWAADMVYNLCSELGGFFLKVAQVIAKPDLAPDAWVKKLVTLCDTAPATSLSSVTCLLEQELGIPTNLVFEEFHKEPLGSASVAQVHQARIRGSKNYVAVKVQHPGVEELMMTDIHNLKAFAAFLRRFDVKFDVLSVLHELEEQVGLEFDFVREAASMDRIADSLSVANRGKPPVMIPRSIPGLVTRRVLTMNFIEGIPLTRLGDEMAKRGIDPNGATAIWAKRKILKDLTAAYGQMILRDGFFQADPHPGNVLVTKDGKVALLDYGQVKHLPDKLRLGFANYILAWNSGNPSEIGRSLEELGVVICKKIEHDPVSLKILASTLFDTKLAGGLKKANPFNKDDVLKKYPVKNFPKEMFFVLRTIHILRGLSSAMGISYSCVDEWTELAKEAISTADKQIPLMENKCNFDSSSKIPNQLVWEKRKIKRQLHFLNSRRK